MPGLTYSPLDNLIHRLGGHVDAWLQDEHGNKLRHGPVTRGDCYVEASYHILEGTVFYICWETHPGQPITALCLTFRPPLLDESANCWVSRHVMDSHRPETQHLISDIPEYTGFLSPRAHESGFVQLEVSKMTRDNQDGYVVDFSQCLILRFNLFGVAADHLPPLLPVSHGSPGPGSTPPNTPHSLREWSPEVIQVEEGNANNSASLTEPLVPLDLSVTGEGPADWVGALVDVFLEAALKMLSE
ncbi:hypothetical protein FB45DRAFT_1000120 [Roridomyces roridus]|uniref:Uncharacterized protein n=1 Tax=Roridomyces roridus TaxID=1738132 RepID=A0AAD7C7W2_9AGAR|nr:hypothetical protein FB45DRAFT_1000120 [Roridomyces roridus]